ncbi:hypothetical protein SAMN05216207_109311 [Pseudonocardia ammonioxydans]|uniref:Uncharacterized protein n=2 Tax=Pseudonocardia TaxID=1847 RepID=A0A1I5IAN3_PSUAM|nr:MULTISPECIES: hypothetical protein [Pseudonocardia]MBP2369921.1 hypothetical protein [Pseudonocardia parietis]SFO57359.1 hypothetical protein SAMN05216207_109311 [Pseudonocardia ammonioxydans]
MSDTVYSVHATKADDVGAVEIVFRTEGEARTYAQSRSSDDRVLSTSVTSFHVGRLGTRRSVAWFVDGVEQSVSFTRRIYPTD